MPAIPRVHRRCLRIEHERQPYGQHRSEFQPLFNPLRLRLAQPTSDHYFLPRIEKSARPSIARTSAEWSRSAPPCAAQDENICWAIAVLGSDRPSSLRRRQRQVEVLLVQPDAEARVERAVEHALGVHLQDARGGEAAHQRRPAPWPDRRRPWPQTPAPRDTAWMFSATMIWLATLQVWPSPFSVADMGDVLAHQSRTAAWRARTPLSGPPTMMVSVACFAPTSPPDTGASR